MLRKAKSLKARFRGLTGLFYVLMIIGALITGVLVFKQFAGGIKHPLSTTSQPPDSRSDQAVKNGAERATFQGHSYDTYTVDLTKTSVKIFFKDSKGNRIGNFQNLKNHLESNSSDLVFATNAGMYTPEGNAVGLLIEQGREISPLTLKDGDGNFYLKPNGVFAITDKGAFVIESTQFEARAKTDKINYATQSGPMLLIEGNFHPQFNKESRNRNIRSGVGIIGPNRITFAISNGPVTLYEFASLFKDYFGCNNALYLDGVISKMYLAPLKRYDTDGDFAGIIAVSDQPR